MIELPKSLARWRSQLELFAPDLGRSLARLIERLAPALGPFRAQSTARAGEVDGFAGIARRGSFERLLMTDWALAELAPDEFLRRAASSELSFLELARREPASARSCAALFDPGPDTLGSPRIVQLAMLIVLAQRAEAAGASFGWQLLDGSPETLHVGLTRANVMALLEGRSAIPTSASDVTAWQERFARGSRLDELWIVGSARTCLRGVAPRVSRVVISELLEPGPVRASVHIAVPQRSSRDLVLDLPDEPTSVRLLRDPFRLAKAASTHSSVAPRSNLVFSGNGRWVFARDERGGVLRYPIPNSAREKPGRPRRYRCRSGATVLAVGQRGTATLMLTVENGSARVESSSSKTFPDGMIEAPLPPECVGEDASASSLRPLVTQHPGFGTDLLWWIGTDGSVLWMPFDRNVAPIRSVEIHREALDGRLLAPAGPSPSDVSIIARVPARGDVRWHIRQAPSATEASYEWEPLDDVDDVVSAFAIVGQQRPTAIAIESRAGQWSVREGTITRKLSPGGRVVGIAANPSDPGLIEVDRDQHALWAVSRAQSVLLARSDERIVEATVCPAGKHLAYTTERGTLVVIKLPGGELLARFEPGREASR